MTCLLAMQATEGSESDKPKSEMKELMQKKIAEMEGIYAAKVTFLDHKKMDEMKDIYGATVIFLDHKKMHEVEGSTQQR
jgi:hypothetical protein